MHIKSQIVMSLGFLVMVSMLSVGCGTRQATVTDRESTGLSGESIDYYNELWKADHAKHLIREGLTPDQIKLENDHRARIAEAQREENVRILQLPRGDGFGEENSRLRTMQTGNSSGRVEQNGRENFVFSDDFTFSETD